MFQSSAGSVLFGSSLLDFIQRPQRSVVLRPVRSLRLIAMWLNHCGSSLDFLERQPTIQCSVFILLPVQCSLVHRSWISFSALSALWFFALLDHCVSSPCGSITAVPRWFSFSALRFTLDLGSPSTPCIRPARSLRFNTMWLDHCGSTLDLPVLRPAR